MKNLKVSEVSFISDRVISIHPLISFLRNAVNDGAVNVLLTANRTQDCDSDFEVVDGIGFLTLKSVPLTEVELEEIRLAKEKEAESILQAKIFSLESKINQQEIGIRSFWTTKAKCEEELAQLRASKK